MRENSRIFLECDIVKVVNVNRGMQKNRNFEVVLGVRSTPNTTSKLRELPYPVLTVVTLFFFIMQFLDRPTYLTVSKFADRYFETVRSLVDRSVLFLGIAR
jgi:hypothetical protein